MNEDTILAVTDAQANAHMTVSAGEFWRWFEGLDEQPAAPSLTLQQWRRAHLEQAREGGWLF